MFRSPQRLRSFAVVFVAIHHLAFGVRVQDESDSAELNKAGDVKELNASTEHDEKDKGSTATLSDSQWPSSDCYCSQDDIHQGDPFAKGWTRGFRGSCLSDCGKFCFQMMQQRQEIMYRDDRMVTGTCHTNTGALICQTYQAQTTDDEGKVKEAIVKVPDTEFKCSKNAMKNSCCYVVYEDEEEQQEKREFEWLPRSQATHTFNSGPMGILFAANGTVEEVFPDGAAYKKGIKKGDLIVEVGSPPVAFSRRDVAIAEMRNEPYKVTFEVPSEFDKKMQKSYGAAYGFIKGFDRGNLIVNGLEENDEVYDEDLNSVGVGYYRDKSEENDEVYDEDLNSVGVGYYRDKSEDVMPVPEPTPEPTPRPEPAVRRRRRMGGIFASLR